MLAGDLLAFVTPAVRRRVPPWRPDWRPAAPSGGPTPRTPQRWTPRRPTRPVPPRPARPGRQRRPCRPRVLLDELLHRGLLRDRRVQQLALDRHLGRRAAALAHASTLADAAAQVVELGAPDVAASRDLDPLDLRRVQRERSLDPDAERLLAHRERLARAVTLALYDNPFEHLRPAPRALDHLEVDAQPVTGVKGRYTAELGTLQAVDHGAHDGADPCHTGCVTRRGLISRRSAPARGRLW